MKLGCCLVLAFSSFVFAYHVQAAGNCQTVLAPHDKTSLDQMMSMLQTSGATAGVLAVISEDRRLEILGASAALAITLYSSFQTEKTVQVCTPPPGFNTLGVQNLKLIGTSEAVRDLLSPATPQGNGKSRLTLGTDYQKLITVHTPLGISDPRLYAPLRLPVVTGDAAKLRGFPHKPQRTATARSGCASDSGKSERRMGETINQLGRGI